LTTRELLLEIDDTTFELRVLLGHLTQPLTSRQSLLVGCGSAPSEEERPEEHHGTRMLLR
jgi:hypothetical protein